MESRIVYAKAHVIEYAGPIFIPSMAVLNPHDGCFSLVRYLERLRLQPVDKIALLARWVLAIEVKAPVRG